MNRKDIQLIAEGYKRVMQEDDAKIAQLAPPPSPLPPPMQRPIPAGMLRAAQPSRPALSVIQRIKMKFPGLQDNQIEEIVAMIKQQAGNMPVRESVVGRISFGPQGKEYGPSNLPPKSNEITIKVTPEEKEQIVNGLIALTDDYSGRGEDKEEYLNTVNALINKLDPSINREDIPADTGAAVWNKPPKKKEVSRPERHRRFQDVHGDISGHVDHE